MKHGAQYAYKVRQCRCPECQAWNTAEQKKYRINRKARGTERLVTGRWVTVPDSQSR